MRSFLGHESQDGRDTRTKAAVIPEAACNARAGVARGDRPEIGPDRVLVPTTRRILRIPP